MSIKNLEKKAEDLQNTNNKLQVFGGGSVFIKLYVKSKDVSSKIHVCNSNVIEIMAFRLLVWHS